jgi:hypothetical protein
MKLLDALSALFYLYVLFFGASLIILFIGLRMAYVAWTEKNDILMRRAKFVLLFASLQLFALLL